MIRSIRKDLRPFRPARLRTDESSSMVGLLAAAKGEEVEEPEAEAVCRGRDMYFGGTTDTH